MNKLSPTAVLLLQKLASKLAEKSSVVSYLTMLLAFFGIKDGNIAVQIAGGLASIAGLVLFILNDQTLSRLIVSKPVTSGDVVEPKVITVPISRFGEQSDGYLMQTALVEKIRTQASPKISKPAATAAPIEEIPMSWLTALAALLANVNPIAQAAVEAVTVVEAIAPNAPGVQKLASAQAYVTKKLGSVEQDVSAVTTTINGIVAAFNQPGMPFAVAKNVTAAVPAPAQAPAAPQPEAAA